MGQPATGAAPHAPLDPTTHMGPVTLAVADLDRSLDFYTRILGMEVLEQEAARATVGAGRLPLLHLVEQIGAQRPPARSTGLYHVAILLPSRADLGRLLLSLARHRYPVGGFGDHGVSEAAYLDDPDGNGLELYRDRPRGEWPYQDGQVIMGTDPVDVDGVLGSVPDPTAPYEGMPVGTVVGHVHLRVGDIPQARAFYSGVLGFDVMFDVGSALFVSAGGYHHHLGMNIWQSRGAAPPPPGSAGLRELVVVLPSAAERDRLTSRLDGAGIAYNDEGGDEAGDGDLLVDDPWSNRLRFVVER